MQVSNRIEGGGRTETMESHKACEHVTLPENRFLETRESILFAHLSVGSCVASLAAAVVAVVGT